MHSLLFLTVGPRTLPCSGLVKDENEREWTLSEFQISVGARLAESAQVYCRPVLCLAYSLTLSQQWGDRRSYHDSEHSTSLRLQHRSNSSSCPCIGYLGCKK
jgi:hypothetical protein